MTKALTTLALKKTAPTTTALMLETKTKVVPKAKHSVLQKAEVTEP